MVPAVTSRTQHSVSHCAKDKQRSVLNSVISLQLIFLYSISSFKYSHSSLKNCSLRLCSSFILVIYLSNSSSSLLKGHLPFHTPLRFHIPNQNHANPTISFKPYAFLSPVLFRIPLWAKRFLSFLFPSAWLSLNIVIPSSYYFTFTFQTPPLFASPNVYQPSFFLHLISWVYRPTFTFRVVYLPLRTKCWQLAFSTSINPCTSNLLHHKASFLSYSL